MNFFFIKKLTRHVFPQSEFHSIPSNSIVLYSSTTSHPHPPRRFPNLFKLFMRFRFLQLLSFLQRRFFASDSTLQVLYVFL